MIKKILSHHRVRRYKINLLIRINRWLLDLLLLCLNIVFPLISWIFYIAFEKVAVFWFAWNPGFFRPCGLDFYDWWFELFWFTATRIWIVKWNLVTGTLIRSQFYKLKFFKINKKIYKKLTRISLICLLVISLFVLLQTVVLFWKK